MAARILAVLAAFCFAAAALAQVKGESGGVYIAGDAFTLDQALADAQRDNARRYAVLALGQESARLTTKGSTPEQREQVRAAQRAGARFYVCQKDLKAAGLTGRDLLPGVRIERGWTQQEQSAPGAEAAGGARRLRRLCS